MVAYENGKVYKIINENSEIIYIGSTTQSLAMRYSYHKHKSKNNRIILIEEHPCSSKEQLLKKEQECIEQNKSCNLLNKYNAYTSDEYKIKYNKQYCINNKDKVASYNKHSYIKHKDKIRKYANEVIQCESCTCYVTRLNMARHRNTDKCKVLSQTLSNN